MPFPVSKSSQSTRLGIFHLILTKLSGPVHQLYDQLFKHAFFQAEWGFVEALLSPLGLGEGVGVQRCYLSIDGVQRYAEGHGPTD